MNRSRSAVELFDILCGIFFFVLVFSCDRSVKPSVLYG